jgi:hypothetical protein
MFLARELTGVGDERPHDPVLAQWQAYRAAFVRPPATVGAETPG